MNELTDRDNIIHRSKYTACVPYKDTGLYLVYSFLTKKFALLTEKQKEILDQPAAHLSSGAVPALLQLGFLSGKDEYAVLLEKLRKRNPPVPQNTGLALEICPTMHCNFDCRYCYEAGRRHTGSMDDETLEAVAEFTRKRILETRATRLSVKWFGGEPTLAFGQVQKLSDRLIAIAKTCGIPYWATIQTNGYLLTQEMVDSFREKQISSMEITIDGNKLSHDRLRVLHDGSGSYDRIMENLSRLRTDIPIRIRCNLHKDNIGAFADLMKEIDRLKELTHNTLLCTPRIIRVEPNLPEDGRFLKDTALTNDEYLTLFNSLYSMNDHADQPRRQDFDNFTKSVAAPCRACNGTGFTIDEMGNLYCCNMEVGDPDLAIGNVRDYENDTSLKHTKSFEFYRRSLCTDREQCKNCVILPTCLGRCPRTWNQFYDCEWLKGNLAETMVKVYDSLNAIQAGKPEDQQL